MLARFIPPTATDVSGDIPLWAFILAITGLVTIPTLIIWLSRPRN